MAIGIACSKLEKNGGGVERQVRDILNGLLDRGWDIEVVAKSADPGLPLVKRLNRGLRLVNVGWLPGKLRDAYFSWRVGRIRKKAGIAPLIACYAHGDLRDCIAYDTDAGRYMDEFIKVLQEIKQNAV